MDEPRYFNDYVRCYSDGRVERKKQDARIRNPKWKLLKSTPTKDGYLRIQIDKRVYVHRVIASCFLNLDMENSEEYVDHRDGVRSNNRIGNLRVVSHQENTWNHTHAKGYSYYKRDNIWTAQIHVDGKKIHLGRFDTEDEAHQAYLAAKLIHHIIPEQNHQ
tara:strand:+ start:141 stop:623 length:483 start_codon:yes stop_codon:yes gene_type:complete